MFFKSITLIIFLLLSSQAAYCKTGILAGARGKLRTISTKYFDIVYPIACESSAKKIASVADDYYLEICGVLQTDAYQRFPVTITNQVESLNAYFTSYPSNRIVLYDTPPDKNLDMYGDTLLSVFYHELTHAVTFNIKPPALRILSNLFSQSMTLANLNITSFWAEGAAVFMESRKGEGRLNDPFALAPAYEGQREDKKLSWRDVTGARDTYPGGNDAYIFGAMFTDYLVRKYGEEKYAEFWARVGAQFTLAFVARIFEDTYGESLSVQWKEFLASIDTSALDPAAVATPFAADRYRGKMRITALDATASTLVYADSSRTAIFESRFDSEKGEYTKAKKILSIAAVQSLRISSDEKRLIIEHFTTRRNTKLETVLYDLEKHRVISRRLYGTDSKESDGLIYAEQNEVLFAGEVVKPMIAKRGMDFVIRLEGEDGYSVDFSLDSSEKVIIHDLHIASATDDTLELLFSFAPIGHYTTNAVRPRAALATIRVGEGGEFEANVRAMSEDLAGGVQNVAPTALFSSDNPVIFYCAAFYDRHQIFTLDLSKVAATDLTMSASVPSPAWIAESAAESTEAATEATVEKYKPLKAYTVNHALLPMNSTATYDRELEVDDDVQMFGLTLISGNYWGGNLLQLSGGFDSEYGIAGTVAQISGGDSAFTYSLSAYVASIDTSFYQTAGSIKTSLLLYSRFISSVKIGANAAYLYGRDRDDDYLSHYGEQVAYATYSNIHKVGSPYEMKAGFALTPFLRGEEFYSDDFLGLGIEQKSKYINTGATLTVRLPFIAPIEAEATLFPSSSYLASGSATVYLYSWEVQRGIPAVSFFLNRIVLSASYSPKIRYECDELFDIKRTDEIARDATIDDYRDEVAGTLTAEFAPNTGAFTSLAMSAGVSVFYRPHKDDGKKSAGARLVFKSSL